VTCKHKENPGKTIYSFILIQPAEMKIFQYRPCVDSGWQKLYLVKIEGRGMTWRLLSPDLSNPSMMSAEWPPHPLEIEELMLWKGLYTCIQYAHVMFKCRQLKVGWDHHSQKSLRYILDEYGASGLTCRTENNPISRTMNREVQRGVSHHWLLTDCDPRLLTDC
jgi:hypothetical protein